jgi:hypothetical protein
LATELHSISAPADRAHVRFRSAPGARRATGRHDAGQRQRHIWTQHGGESIHRRAPFHSGRVETTRDTGDCQQARTLLSLPPCAFSSTVARSSSATRPRGSTSPVRPDSCGTPGSGRTGPRPSGIRRSPDGSSSEA